MSILEDCSYALSGHASIAYIPLLKTRLISNLTALKERESEGNNFINRNQSKRLMQDYVEGEKNTLAKLAQEIVQIERGLEEIDDIKNKTLRFLPDNNTLKFFYKGATVATAPIVFTAHSAYFLLASLIELTKAIAYACVFNFQKSEEYFIEFGSNALWSAAKAVYAPFSIIINLWNLIDTAITSCKSASTDDELYRGLQPQ